METQDQIYADLRVGDGKINSVTNNDDHRHGLRAQVSVGVNQIIETEGHTGGARERKCSGSDEQTDPMYVMRRSDTPMDDRPGDEDKRHREQPEAHFRFEDPTVLTDQAQHNVGVYVAAKERPSNIVSAQDSVISGKMAEQVIVSRLTQPMFREGRKCMLARQYWL
jgi:hypothetical protein